MYVFVNRLRCISKLNLKSKLASVNLLYCNVQVPAENSKYVQGAIKQNEVKIEPHLHVTTCDYSNIHLLTS